MGSEDTDRDDRRCGPFMSSCGIWCISSLKIPHFSRVSSSAKKSKRVDIARYVSESFGCIYQWLSSSAVDETVVIGSEELVQESKNCTYRSRCADLTKAESWIEIPMYDPQLA
jgi:hypothetical protein